MTVEQVNALNSSPAGQFNDTGKIPYVAIIDPFTLKKMKPMPGGGAAGQLMDAVIEAKKQLNAAHGPSVKRTTLQKLTTGVKAVEATLAKDGVAKAFADYRKLESSVAKEPEAVKAKVQPLFDKLMEAARTQLDDAEGKIAAGDLKGAEKIVKSLASPLKGTDLEARVRELLEKTKPAPETK
jgi:hypothetical protein